MPQEEKHSHNAPPLSVDLEKARTDIAAWAERWKLEFLQMADSGGITSERYNTLEALIEKAARTHLEQIRGGMRPSPELFDRLVELELKNFLKTIPSSENPPPLPQPPPVPINLTPEKSLPPLGSFSQAQQDQELSTSEVSHSDDSPAAIAPRKDTETATELPPEIAHIAEKIAAEQIALFPDTPEEFKEKIRNAAKRLGQNIAGGTDASEPTFRRLLQFDPEWLNLTREIARRKNVPFVRPVKPNEKQLLFKSFGELAGLTFGQRIKETPNIALSHAKAPVSPENLHEQDAKTDDKEARKEDMERITVSVGDEFDITGFSEVPDGHYRLVEISDDGKVALGRIGEGGMVVETVWLDTEKFSRMLSEFVDEVESETIPPNQEEPVSPTAFPSAHTSQEDNGEKIPQGTSATKEPPPEIEGNAEPAIPGRSPDGVYPKQDQAAAERAEKANVINEKGEEYRRNMIELRILENESKKRKLTDKESERLRALRTERDRSMKELTILAREMLGEEAMRDAFKWIDPEDLKAFSTAVRGLSDEERKKRIAELPKEIRFAKALEGKLRRRFENTLTRSGVSEEIAHILYRNNFDRMIQLCRIADDLEANDGGVREKLAKKNPHLEEVLNFHGIAERDPEKLKEVLAPIVAQYRTMPKRPTSPHEPRSFLERVKDAAERGVEVPSHVLYNVLRRGRSPEIIREGSENQTYWEGGTREERAWAEAELRRRGLNPDIEPNEENPHWWADQVNRGMKRVEDVPPQIEQMLRKIARYGKNPERSTAARTALEHLRNERKRITAQGVSRQDDVFGGAKTPDASPSGGIPPPTQEIPEIRDVGSHQHTSNGDILPPKVTGENEIPSPVQEHVHSAASADSPVARLPRPLRNRVQEVEDALREHPETVPRSIVEIFHKAGFPWATNVLEGRGVTGAVSPSRTHNPREGGNGNGPSSIGETEEGLPLKKPLEEVNPGSIETPIPNPTSTEETPFAKAMREVREGTRRLALEPLEEKEEIRPSDVQTFREDAQVASNREMVSGNETPKALSPGITPGAENLLQNIDEGGVPLFISEHFKRILEENGIPYRTDMTPEEAVESLRQKARMKDAQQQEVQDETPEPKTIGGEEAVRTEENTPHTQEEKRQEEALDPLGQQWEHFIEVNYGDKSLHEAREAIRREEEIRGKIDEAAARGDVLGVIAAEAESVGANAEAPKVLTPETLRRYEEEFRVPMETLAAIPEFAALTEGQRLLVLRDVNRTMISRIHSRALKDFHNEYEALGGLTEGEKKFLAEGKTKTGKWWRRFAVGMLHAGKKSFWKKVRMSLARGKIIADKKNEIRAALREGKFDHTELVRQLARDAKYGPEGEMVNGKVLVKFVKESDFAGPLTPEELERIKTFNKVATDWMDMPHAFIESDATAEERAAYENAKSAYTRVLYDILELKRLKMGERASAFDVLDIDRRITLQQFFNSHPGEAERFADLKDTNAWWEWIRSTGLLRTKAFAMGAAIRTVAAGTIASVAAPIAAIAAAPVAGAVVGRFMGRERAKIELEDRETLRKMGVRDASPEAKNIVDVDALARKIERLRASIAEIPADTKDPALKEKRNDLIRSLEARYWYTKEKIEKGLINFGDNEAEAHRNRFALAQALGTAIGVAEVEKQWDNRLKARLRRFIDYKERIIKTREGEYVDRRGKEAMIHGAAAAGMGAVLADLFHGIFTGRGASAELFGIGRTSENVSSSVSSPKTLQQEPYPFAESHTKAPAPQSPVEQPPSSASPRMPEQEPYPFAKEPSASKPLSSEPVSTPEIPSTPPPRPSETLTFERLPNTAQEEVAAQFFLLNRTPTTAERDALAFLSYLRNTGDGDPAELLRYDDTYRILVRAMELRDGTPLPDSEIRRILEEAGVGERMRQYLPELWGMPASVAGSEPASGGVERIFSVQDFTPEKIQKNIVEMRDILAGVRAPSAPETALYGRLKFLQEHPPQGLTPGRIAEVLDRFTQVLRASGKSELTSTELQDFLRREQLERHVPFEYLKPLFGKALPR